MMCIIQVVKELPKFFLAFHPNDKYIMDKSPPSMWLQLHFVFSHRSIELEVQNWGKTVKVISLIEDTDKGIGCEVGMIQTIGLQDTFQKLLPVVLSELKQMQ